MPLAPSDDELTVSLKALRAQLPSSGAAKLLSKLLADNPGWAVSEKRVKRLLAQNNLQLNPPPPKAPSVLTVPDLGPRPSSRVIDNLSPAKWSSKLKVVHFGPAKGKGLVATQEIAEGEDVWKEDPFIISPGWDIYDLQVQSRACAFCTTLFTNASSVSQTVACPNSNGICSARFCNRLCLRRGMARSHPLLCPSTNPASVPLLAFVRRANWLAAHAVAQCIACLLLSHEQGREDDLKNDLQFLDALAQMSMEERWKVIEPTGVQPDLETWQRAHKFTFQALHTPSNASDRKQLSKMLKKPLPEDLSKRLFELDAYLRLLTCMSLNLEAHGGLYVLHSHMNHSCDPNVSVRHFDQKTALSRITMRARRVIKPGEELTVTYVDPSMPLRARRSALIPWVFGKCTCIRCAREEREAKERGEDVSGEDEKEGEEKHPGLEEELRHGLGIL